MVEGAQRRADPPFELVEERRGNQRVLRAEVVGDRREIGTRDPRDLTGGRAAQTPVPYAHPGRFDEPVAGLGRNLLVRFDRFSHTFV